MPGGKDKKQKKQQNHTGFLDDFVNVEGPEPAGAGRNSIPELEHYSSNELNLHFANLRSNVNEAMREEAEHKKREQQKSGSVKDQNGSAPQNESADDIDFVLEGLEDISLGSNRGSQRISNQIDNGNLINNEGNQAVQEQVPAPMQAPEPERVPAEPQQIPEPQHEPEPQQIPAPQQAAEQQPQPVPDPIQEPDNQQLDAQAQLDNPAPQQNQANTFVPQPQAPRSKWSKTAQANNAVWRTVGKTIGRLSVLPASLAGKPIMARIKHNAHEKTKNGQQTRNHKEIPGWNGKKFSPEKTSGADILEDFRRVPTVWSYLTAGEAEDLDGNEIPPKVTVYVEQPKTGSSRSMHYLEMGHTMLGIEYTRYSKITGRKERYNIKYGFYPAGGMTTFSACEMMLRGAVLPGQLQDDATHVYDISKSYTATRNQIEDIAKASESYTDQGGYGYYTRNCATFVRDMFRAGHIPEDTINSIFTEEKVRFNSLGNTGLVFADSWNCFFNTSVQRKMGNLADSEDRSYQGWGNKRVTNEDLERYRNTKNTAGFGIKSLAPASAGENMRRMTDPAGQIGSYRYAPESLRKNPEDDAKDIPPATFHDLLQAVRLEGGTLLYQINEIMTTEEKALAGADFNMWCLNLATCGSRLAALDFSVSRAFNKLTKEEAKEAKVYEFLTPEELKNAHASVSGEIAEISLYYQTVLGADKRLNRAVMNLLSALEISLRMIDKMYNLRDKAEDVGEIGTLREDMLKRYHKIKVGDIEVEMTPSHYEAYLQIYKTPLEAVKAYDRYQKLKDERDGDDSKLKGVFSNKKLAEWKMLSRNEELADQFDSAHKTMLNKDKFTQRDIDYAFNLRKKEAAGKRAKNTSAIDSTMYTNHATASETYMALFFDKIFGGIQSTAMKSVQDGGVPPNANTMIIALWLDKYLAEKTRQKMNGMAMIIRGIMQAYDGKHTDKLIKESFHHFLQHAYLEKAFPNTASKGQSMFFLGSQMNNIYGMISKNRQTEFTKTIDSLVRIVMMENKPVTQLNADKKKKKK